MKARPLLSVLFNKDIFRGGFLRRTILFAVWMFMVEIVEQSWSSNLVPINLCLRHRRYSERMACPKIIYL